MPFNCSNNNQLERYSQQIVLQEIGLKGQTTLGNSRVLIVGVGGLGSPAALYLAAAGIGTIGLVDSDEVELSNLQRQIIHYTPDTGRLKIDSAAGKVAVLNPHVRVEAHSKRVNANNIDELIENYDLVIDGTDNLASKFLINDACVLAKKPLCYAGVQQFFGQAFTILPGEGPCYGCLFPRLPDSAVERQEGVLGTVAGILGTIQATEAIKVLLSIGEPLMNRLLVIDVLSMSFRTVRVSRNWRCPVCGSHFDA